MFAIIHRRSSWFAFSREYHKLIVKMRGGKYKWCDASTCNATKGAFRFRVKLNGKRLIVKGIKHLIS